MNGPGLKSRGLRGYDSLLRAMLRDEFNLFCEFHLAAPLPARANFGVSACDDSVQVALVRKS